MSTRTSPAVIDPESATIERTVFIRAPIAAVWDALTVPELIAEWFGDAAELDAVRVGERGVLTWDEHGDYPFVITAAEAPTLLEFRWGETGDEITDENSTVARLTLAEEAGGTVLHLLESAFEVAYPDRDERAEALDGNREGWDVELDELAAVLEKQDSQ